jgi:D-galactarolactone cycloisomerase
LTIRAVKTLRRLSIRAIETTAIRVPLARVYRGSQYEMAFRSTILCRVLTDDGIVGEAWAGDEDGALEEIRAIIHREIEPGLMGVDALATERTWQLSRPVTFDILRDRRLGLVASACVDAALWDAVGKALEVPLWRLWGGYRNSLPMISIGGYYGDLDIAEEIAQLRELGVAGMKFKVGGRDPATDAERFLKARAAAGDDFILCADANQGWSTGEAIEFARRVEGAGLEWFEEPCRWDTDRISLRDVRMKTGVRVCAGQSEHSAAGCRELMAAGAVDVCNFDSSWSGGPTEWRRVAAVAATFGLEMGHHEEPQVAAHLLAAVPHGTYVECFHPDRDPIWWNLPANRPSLVDGRLPLSDRPGLGWELDPDFIARYQVADQ